MSQIRLAVNVSLDGAAIYVCVCMPGLPEISASGPDAGSAMLALEATATVQSLILAGFEIAYDLSSA